MHSNLIYVPKMFTKNHMNHKLLEQWAEAGMFYCKLLRIKYFILYCWTVTT